MSEMNKQLRDFIDAGATPVTSDEILSRIITSPKTTEFELRRARNKRRLLVSSGVTVLIIVLLSIGLIAVPGDKNSGVAPVSAATFLKSVAIKAANQKALVPGPRQYLYIATITNLTNGSALPPTDKMFFYDANELRQVWVSPHPSGHQTTEVVGRPTFITAADREIWMRDGSPLLESGSSAYGPPVYYNVLGLPTTPSKLVAYFKSQPYLTPETDYGNFASWEFEMAVQFLQNDASSAQRAALLNFIATIPGIKFEGTAKSIVTRERGSVIGLFNKVSGLDEQALFNPETSTLIELRLVRASLRSTTPSIIETKPFVGEIESYVDLVFAGLTRVNTLYSLPSGVPKFAPAWPSGALRMPLPRWLPTATSITTGS